MQGTTRKNLPGLLHSRAWNEFWEDAHDKIVAALQRSDVSKLLVVCYCKKGRHRSVGVRALLHHCLLGAGVERIALNDLCSGRLWKHFCDGAHSRCTECHPRGGQLACLAESVRVDASEQWFAFENSLSHHATMVSETVCSVVHDEGWADSPRISERVMPYAPDVAMCERAHSVCCPTMRIKCSHCGSVMRSHEGFSASCCQFECSEFSYLDPVNEWCRDICWCVQAESL